MWLLSQELSVSSCAQVNDPFGSHACLETSETDHEDIGLIRPEHVAARDMQASEENVARIYRG